MACDLEARYKLKDTDRKTLRSLVKAKKDWADHHHGEEWMNGEERKALEEQLQSSWSQPRCRFFMHDFEKNRRTNAEWMSEPFYQAPLPNGTARYKLQLSVYANGYGEARDEAMSVFVYLLEGEDDDELHWPVRVETTVLLLDQRRDANHIKRTIALEGHRSSGAGVPFGYLNLQPQQSVVFSLSFGSPLSITTPPSSGASGSGGSASPWGETTHSVRTRSSAVKQKKRKGKGKGKTQGEGSDLRFVTYGGSNTDYWKDGVARFEVTTVNIKKL